MGSQGYITRETFKKKPVLIIDKTGIVGSELCRILYREFLPVFVSEIRLQKDLAQHIIHIPFQRRAPKIPENNFAHIFFIDCDNRYVRSMIQSVLSFARATNTNVSLVTSIYHAKLRGFEKLSVSPLVKTFVTGDVFSEQHDKSYVSEILAKAYYEKEIVLTNNGLSEVYATSVYEVAKGIVDLTFSHAVTQSVINIYPDFPSTYLSLSRHIIHIDPDVKLDFKKSREKSPHPKWLAKNGWHLSSPPLDTQLKYVYSRFASTTPQKTKQKKMTSGATLFPFGPYVAAVGFSLFLVCLLPLLLILGSAFLGKALTTQAMEKLERGAYQDARQTAENADASFVFANRLTEFAVPLSKRIGRGKTLESFSNMLETGSSIDAVLIDMSYALEEYKASTILPDRGESIQKASLSMQRLKQAVLTLLDISTTGSFPDEYKNRVDTYIKLGEYFLSLSDVLPEVLGYTRAKTYLVLFQNNNELRPGGGFIGSYGLVTLDKGAIKEFTIHDVYDADGQLSAHVEPPKPLRDYMGTQHWYLRDSNFSPDFVENAARAAYFLKLETGDEVDGVFAIDTTFLQGLLSATGPITVEEYNDTVTAENFSEKTQSQIEDTFFPGSQTKRTFLTAVSDDLYQKLLTGKGISYEKLLSGIVSAISEKHLMVAFADQSLQLPFTASNLSGTLWDPRTEESNTRDFLGIVEANVGLNKVNPYIERYISQTTRLTSENQIQTTLSIRYKNTSTETTKFGGLYKNYLQLLMPQDTDVTGVSLNDEEKVILTSEQVRVTTDLENAEVRGNLIVERNEVSGRRSVGFLIDVPVGQTVHLEVDLQKGTEFSDATQRIDYSTYLFKQPGRPNDPYTFTFVYPDSYQLLDMSSQLKGGGGEVTAFFLLDSDKEFDLKLGKK